MKAKNLMVKNSLMAVVVSSSIFLLALMGCSSSKKSKSDVDIRSIEWSLVSVKSGDQLLTPGKERVPTLKISEEGMASGSSGCNRFTGPATVEGGKIKFGNLASTRMFCPEGMNIEDALLKVLLEVDNFTVKNGDLLLRKGNEVLATYASSQ